MENLQSVRLELEPVCNLSLS